MARAPASLAIERASLSQRLVQECDSSRESVGGRFGSITIFILGILEPVPGAVVDLDVYAPSEILHRPFERPHVPGRNAAVVGSKVPEYGCKNLLEVVGIGRKRAVIHHASGEARLMNRELQRIPAAHAPPN